MNSVVQANKSVLIMTEWSKRVIKLRNHVK